MSTRGSHVRLSRLVRWTPSMASVSVAALGTLVLVGWLLEIELFKSLLHPGRVAMNPTTAVCFILVAAALFLLQREDVTRPRRRAAQIAAGIAILVGLSRVFGYLFHWNEGLDLILFRSRLGDNAMAPNTAVGFVLIGSALALLDTQTRRGRHVAQFFVLAVGAIAVLALIGYLYSIATLYGVTGFIPMALNTAVAFALLVAGALCARPDRQPVATLLDDTVGGAVARRLLPAAFLLPILLGYLRIIGERLDWFSADFGLTLLVLGLIIILNWLIWWNAQIQRRVDLQRRVAEIELRQSETRFRKIVETANDAFVAMDSSGCIIDFNPQAEVIFGWKRDEAAGRELADTIIPSRYRDAHRKGLETFLATGKGPVLGQRLELSALHRDGHEFPIELTIAAARISDGHVFFAFVHDITERKRIARELEETAHAEREAHQKLKLAQSALVQSEKLAGLGQMVAGVAHEINNPLAFVSNNVAVLQRDLRTMSELLALYARGDAALQEKMPELAREIRELSERMDLAYTTANLADIMSRSREGLKRIQQIVGDLRDFARLDSGDLHEADINAGIESTINIVRGLAKKKQVTIETHLAPLPQVTCYPAKINQVVMNLLTNAIDASAPQGRVTIATAMDAGAVKIEVADEGHGIDPAVRERIFDPFFTTKKLGEGTGLGLSISYGIVKDHGGRIDVESEVGRGSKFTVVLPLRAQPRAATPRQRGATTPP